MEAIVGEDGETQTTPKVKVKTAKMPDETTESINTSLQSALSSPESDSTAQKIMHLLTELGSPHALDRSSTNNYWNVIHCTNCLGNLIVV